MRVAIIADSHFDESTRFEECVSIHQWIVNDVYDRGVDLVLHAGDVFERASTPKERLAVREWLLDLAITCPVVIVRGNHDAPGDLEFFDRLRGNYPIIVEENAGVHHIAGVCIQAMAWPRKANVLSMLEGVGREAGEAVAGEALRNVLRGLDHDAYQRGPAYPHLPEPPRILLAHAMVSGSRTSTGQPLTGCNLELGLQDLELAGADFVALGHIHLGQDWRLSDGTPVVYPGSPRRCTFGEREPKGYVVVDLDKHGGPVSWEHIDTPCTPMLHIEAHFDGDRMVYLDDSHDVEVDAAEVRFRYHTAPEHREAARERADRAASRWLSVGAIHVKLEEVVEVAQRARAPEVAAAQGIGPKLRAYWRAKDDVPEEPRAVRLVGGAAEVEEEVRHAV